MIQSKHGDNIYINVDPEYTEIRSHIARYYEEAVPLLQAKWGQGNVGAIHIYLCKDPIEFMLSIARGIRKALWVIFLPFWAGRVKRFYKRAGGVTLQLHGDAYIWLRPPDEYEYVDKTIGNILFGKIEDPYEKLQFVFVHELTHAHIGNRNLPSWLNEGIAMISVDAYFKKCTVLEDVLESFIKEHRRHALVGYHRMAIETPDNIAFTYAYGYWATEYIETVSPGLIKEALSHSQRNDEIMRYLYSGLGIKSIRGPFGDQLYEYYSKTRDGKI